MSTSLRKFVTTAVFTLPLLTFSSLAIAGCVASSVEPLPDAPTVESRPMTSAVPDLSNVSVPTIPGKTTTTLVQLKPGNSAVSGRVLNGNTPIGGASVRIERLVGDSAATVDLKTGDDGVFRLDGVSGGRYRLRAYKPPAETMASSQVVFISAGENRVIDLNMSSFGGEISIKTAVAPNPPFIGQDANLVVSLNGSGVDALGVARSIPQDGVELWLQTDGGRSINGPNRVVTNASGRAQWSIRCNSNQNQGIRVVTPDGVTHVLNIAECKEAPPTTTTTVFVEPLPPPTQ